MSTYTLRRALATNLSVRITVTEDGPTWDLEPGYPADGLTAAEWRRLRKLIRRAIAEAGAAQKASQAVLKTERPSTFSQDRNAHDPKS